MSATLRYRVSPFEWAMMLLSGFLLLFVAGPLIGMALHTTGHDLVTAGADREVQSSIVLTLVTSMGATLCAAIFAIPLAWLLARRNFPLRGVVNGLVSLPVVIPHTAAGIAVLGFISKNSFLGGTAAALGHSFVGHPTGIAIAMAFVSLPYLINAARDGFMAVPERLEQVALTLGASPARVFFTVSLPLAWRSIVTGLVMMFARGMSEFGAVVIIAYHPMVAPVLVYERFGAFGLRYARPVALIFIAVALLVFLAMQWLAHQNKEDR